MAQKAIVKLCLCLALILLVGVATSAWSQSASGDNMAKGASSSSSSKKAAMCGGIAGLKCPERQACPSGHFRPAMPPHIAAFLPESL